MDLKENYDRILNLKLKYCYQLTYYQIQVS